MQDISPILRDYFILILNAVLAAAVPVLVAYAVKWLDEKRKVVESNLSLAQLEAYKFVAKNAVLAAEQLHLDKQITDRKDWAEKQALAWLEAQGYKNVDLNTVSNFIEAALVEEFNKFKKEMDIPTPLKEVTPEK